MSPGVFSQKVVPKIWIGSSAISTAATAVEFPAKVQPEMVEPGSPSRNSNTELLLTTFDSKYTQK